MEVRARPQRVKQRQARQIEKSPLIGVVQEFIGCQEAKLWMVNSSAPDTTAVFKSIFGW
jgi:hypothetical protein